MTNLECWAYFKGLKANQKVLEEFLSDFDLTAGSVNYEVPIYYILGDNDWQAPYVIAKEYFSTINTPYKKLYMVYNAGHRIMLDQTDLFIKALLEINNKEKQNQLKWEWKCYIR